ncbi:diaminobutyrate acetyltransferase, partial [Chloroflexota bacterium]
MNNNNKLTLQIISARKEDGPDIHKLVSSCPALDQNSSYLYLLLCSHFNKYTLTARIGSELIGFVSAYPHPHLSSTIFIWQIAISPNYRKHGIAIKMIRSLIQLALENDLTYIEATVTPSNFASLNMFKKIADIYAAEIQKSVYFPDTLFTDGHEDELLLRIGPIKKEVNRMRIFEQVESQVRSYVRAFPAVFNKAKGALLYDEQGTEYIDFFAGAGVINYGHNNPTVSNALIEYIQQDGIIHSLDKATSAKKRFLEKLYYDILQPRNMEYKVQFTGPTGTNAVETALKLARMVKGRSNIIAFSNAFHGLTMGSMAITGNAFYRDESFINRTNVSFLPYDGYFGPEVNTAVYLRKFLSDQSSGVDLPSAIILETVQAEGGVNVASHEWLVEIEQICRDFDILLIVDDIQVGNGRTGT